MIVVLVLVGVYDGVVFFCDGGGGGVGVLLICLDVVDVGCASCHHIQVLCCLQLWRVEVNQRNDTFLFAEI